MGRGRPLVVGNWKMYKTIGEALAFVDDLLAIDPACDTVDAAICPPFTALAAVAGALGGSAVAVGAQTMSFLDEGALTGEISPAMLVDCGATCVILGHSERRAQCGETDDGVNRKVHAALRAGLVPIVAVGESADEHARGESHARVIAQTRAAFDGIDPATVARCVVAYEPIWAIGSGSPDRPDNADAVMGAIRASVAGLGDARVLYGGSVKPDNIGAFVAQPNIDGALVGSASLRAISFAALISNARAAVAS